MRMWSLRGLGSSFVTLTYDDHHLPADLSVQKHVMQKFMRDIRYHGGECRFLAAGEYGGEFGRPHYHACLFGLDFLHDRKPVRRTPRGLLYSSATLSRAWPFGFATITDCNLKTISYVARYTVKKVDARGDAYRLQRFNEATGETWFVEPEFALMSRMPGLGAGWLDRFGATDLAGDHIIIDGKKLPIPNYYLDRLPDAERDRIKRARRANAILNTENNTEKRLITRHEFGELRASDFKRSLDQAGAS